MGRGTRIKPVSFIQGQIVKVSEDTDSMTPAWCFKNLQKEYSFSDIDNFDDLKTLMDGILSRGGRTWKEIKSSPAESAGMCVWAATKLKKPIPEKYKNETLFKFYVGGKKGGRVLGYRFGRIQMESKEDLTNLETKQE